MKKTSFYTLFLLASVYHPQCPAKSLDSDSSLDLSALQTTDFSRSLTTEDTSYDTSSLGISESSPLKTTVLTTEDTSYDTSSLAISESSPSQESLSINNSNHTNICEENLMEVMFRRDLSALTESGFYPGLRGCAEEEFSSNLAETLYYLEPPFKNKIKFKKVIKKSPKNQIKRVIDHQVWTGQAPMKHIYTPSNEHNDSFYQCFLELKKLKSSKKKTPREYVIGKLLKNLERQDLRKLIAPEIRYLVENFHQVPEQKGLILEKMKKADNFADALFHERQHKKSFSFKGKIEDFYETEWVCRSYVECFLGYTFEGEDYYPQPYQWGLMSAIAEVFQRDLFVYEEQNSRIILKPSYFYKTNKTHKLPIELMERKIEEEGCKGIRFFSFLSENPFLLEKKHKRRSMKRAMKTIGHQKKRVKYTLAKGKNSPRKRKSQENKKHHIPQVPMRDQDLHKSKRQAFHGIHIENDFTKGHKPHDEKIKHSKKIFKATIDGKAMKFTRENVSGFSKEGLNNACLFNALGLDVEDTITKLLERKEDRFLRRVVACEVANLFYSDEYFRNEFGKHINKLIFDYLMRKTNNSKNPLYSLMHKAEICLEIYEAFVKHFIKGEMMSFGNRKLDDNSDRNYTIIDAITYVHGIGAVVCIPNPNGTSRRDLEAWHYSVFPGTEITHYVYHGGGGSNHFQILNPRP